METLYSFLETHIPVALQRPFMMSSICPLVLVPLFRFLEWWHAEWFVQRDNKEEEETRTSFPVKRRSLWFDVLEMGSLFLLGLTFDPYRRHFTLAFAPLPANNLPTWTEGAVWTLGLVLFFEGVNSGLHWLFHRVRWLYTNFHYVHHLDTDPSVSSTTKLHMGEVLLVFVGMNVLPGCFLQPHPLCLLAGYMSASVLALIAHSGLRGVYICDYHRKHHRDPRCNMLTPLLSYADRVSMKTS